MTYEDRSEMGGGTFDCIIDNLEKIKQLSKEYIFTIMIRYNILPDDNNFIWYDFLQNKFGDDDRFCVLIRTVNDMGGDLVKNINILNSTKKEITIKNHMAYAHKIGLKTANDSMELSNALNQNVCYAAYRNHYAIRANGAINKCTVSLDEPKNQIGFLDVKGDMHINEILNKEWYNNTLDDNCFNCKKILSCMNSICPMNKIVNSISECIAE